MEKLVIDGVGFEAKVIESSGMIGGGSLPVALLPGYAVEIEPLHCKVSILEKELRYGSVPIIARIEENKLILDMRTVMDDELSIIANRLRDIDKKVMA